MKGRRRIKWILGGLMVPLSVIVAAILVFYIKQDAIIQSELSALNQGYTGKISLGDSHLSLFENFPYVSLKIDDVTIAESKDEHAQTILAVSDIYVGFKITDLLVGDYIIHSIVVEDGFFDLVLHPDGTTNIEIALQTQTQEEEVSTPIAISLNKIELIQLEFHQREEATELDIATSISHAVGGFNTDGNLMSSHVDAEFTLNVTDHGDTTYFNHKHFEFHTDLSYNTETGFLQFAPSGITMEHGDFELSGSVDTKHEMHVDIALKGTKPSFDMFIAFAPTEVIPILERYENAGKIYFNATLEGPTTNGRQPAIAASFGADEAYLENTTVGKRIDDMGFSGSFTNGSERSLATMKFVLKDVSANMEKGRFLGSVSVTNFEVPDIQMELDADFDLKFWADFLNLEDVDELGGSVNMVMKFHDIIDLDHPEKSIKELSQAYYAELNVADFTLNSNTLPAPIEDLDIHLEMNGKRATLDKFDMKMGGSDLNLSGYLSDLPAIVHHTPTPVEAHLKIAADKLDLAQLTDYNAKDSTGINELISDLLMEFSFDASGNAFTEFSTLPNGSFYLDGFYAKLQNYPHALHDFHADLSITDDEIEITDFTGHVDATDFHFNGKVRGYPAFLEDSVHELVHADITLTSDLFRPNDLFTYGGENHVPIEYRDEEIERLKLHVGAKALYDSSTFKSISVNLDEWSGKMHLHPLRFEEFNGFFKYANENLTVRDFHGKLGHSSFTIDLNYYLGDDLKSSTAKNLFSIKSPSINFDELFNFNVGSPEKIDTSSTKTTADSPEHADAFNLFELPFSDMDFNVEIDHFTYHRYNLRELKTRFHTTPDHYLHLDTLSVNAAGGSFAMNGYLDGTDPDHIYLKPHLHITNVYLDQLLYKFENFGQDELVSNNLHGKLTASIWGDIRVYPDLTPDLDQSEVHLDAQILNGRLEDYEPMLLLADYFGDKDLTNIRFDTIENHMDLTRGLLSIPNMTIESTLGHLELSGTQDMNDNIDYFMRIPWSLVKEASKNKLFGARRDEDSPEDEIIELDPNKKVKYLNINMVGTLDSFDIKLKKPKSGNRLLKK